MLFDFKTFQSDLRGLGLRSWFLFAVRDILRSECPDPSDTPDIPFLQFLGLGETWVPDELLSEGATGQAFFHPPVANKTDSDHLLCPAD